jgi:hypothetical protein
MTDTLIVGLALQVKSKDDKGGFNTLTKAGVFIMTLYEKIPLPNGLTLEIWDDSRQLAADTTKVELAAQIMVEFEAGYFPRREQYDKLVKTIGPRGLYERRKIRAYVTNAQKDAVFQEMLSSFKESTLPYLAREEFPRQFTRSKSRDMEQNWYKYDTRNDEG